MIKVTKVEMRDKLISLMELGLTNAEIADRLNEEYNADERNSINAMGVSKLKAQVGVKNMKPKKKSLFELVDDEDNVPQNEVAETLAAGIPVEKEELASDFF